MEIRKQKINRILCNVIECEEEKYDNQRISEISNDNTKSPTHKKDVLINSVMGLCGESGEGNEFKVSWDAEQFAPLEENMKLPHTKGGHSYE